MELDHGRWKVNKKGLELMEKVFDIPSTMVDKVHCICQGPNARLTFVENVPEMDNEVPRVSVTMPLPAFFEMLGMLNDVAAQVQAQTPISTPIEPPKPEAPKDDVLH